MPRPETPEAPLGPPPAPPTAALPPHLAGEDELGLTETDPDWWRVDPSPFGGGMPGGLPGETVPGFTGGIELPEVRKPPPPAPRPSMEKEPRKKRPRARDEAEDEYDDDGVGDEDDELEDADGTEAYAGRGAAVRELLRSSGPMEVLAIAALLAGAVLGNLIAVVIGWLLPWGSRRLSRTEAKWATLGIPGVVATGALVWFWGRFTGRWGEPLTEKAFSAELTAAFPWVVRAAAVASVLFLIWRARRRLV
jgi:hypothetical protein